MRGMPEDKDRNNEKKDRVTKMIETLERVLDVIPAKDKSKNRAKIAEKIERLEELRLLYEVEIPEYEHPTGNTITVPLWEATETAGVTPAVVSTFTADFKDLESNELRFSWRMPEERREVIVFEEVWQHDGGENIKSKYECAEYSTLVEHADQEVPDFGMQRKPTSKTQEATTDEESGSPVEQIWPWSNSKSYEDGEHDFKSKVTPGTFKDSTQMQIPNESWTPEDDISKEGRLTFNPGEPEESFDGSLDESEFENVVDSDVNK